MSAESPSASGGGARSAPLRGASAEALQRFAVSHKRQAKQFDRFHTILLAWAALTAGAAGLLATVVSVDTLEGDTGDLVRGVVMWTAAGVMALLLVVAPHTLARRCTKIALLIGFYSYISTGNFVSDQAERRHFLDTLEAEVDKQRAKLGWLAPRVEGENSAVVSGRGGIARHGGRPDILAV